MREDSMRLRSFNTPCYCGSRHDGHGAEFHTDNLCVMRSAYNPHLVWCSASNQRVGGGGAACAGLGNGDPAGAGAAAVPLGGFGFFGFSTCFRAALGGGPAG